MKKRVMAVALTGVIALVGLLPGMILNGVQHYQVLAPRRMSYRPSVRCEGTVCPAESYDLLSAGLYRVEERHGVLGDPVGAGEVLAVLVPVAREPVLYLQTMGSGLGLGDEADLAALAQSYGLEELALPAGNSPLTVPAAEGEGSVPVTSPISGVLTKEVPAPGSVVTPGSAICSVEGQSEYFARLSVGERDAAKLTVGSEVVLTGEGVGLITCPGVLTKIYPGTRRERSGTILQNVVDIEVSIPPGTPGIRPGFSVKAQIFTAEEREIMVLPYESVYQDSENHEYVLVAGAYRLEKRRVTTGQETNDGIEIVEGLLAEELVTVLAASAPLDSPGRYLLEWEE